MLTRLQKSLKEKDQGFTLIELLVVIVIIGILAAIAIPLFLNQRKKGVDASLKSDLKSAATTVETYSVDGSWNAATGDDVTPVVTEAKITTGNTVTLVGAGTTATGYCMIAVNDAGGATGPWYYHSTGGGLQAAGDTCTCP